MLDRPTGGELLEEARRLLLEDVAPKLSGEDRYKVLMAANAMAMATRELALDSGAQAAEEEALRGLLTAAGQPVQGDPQKAFARAVRQGAFADSAEAYALLRRQVETRVGLSNPKALTA